MNLQDLSKERLLELMEIYAKNWLALDGVWFQSIEEKFGMEEAIYHDAEAWKRYTVIEAKRIKKFLGLPERPGLDGLEQAFAMRLYANLNPFEAERTAENKMVFRVLSCRVQTARNRKNMEPFPCRSVGEIEYEGFARAIDDRIRSRCLSCPPDITDDSCGCAWGFTIED